MNRIINLDKTVKELTNRLDVVYPLSSSSSNEIKHDGINYWNGKRIIPVKRWNELYEKNSTTTGDNYKIMLISRKPLQYFPEDYNGSISSFEVIDELKEEVHKWNVDYSELLEFRQNPTLGRRKCSKCLLSGFFDDPIFVGIEKVFSKIIKKQCNNNDNIYADVITYPCEVMNIFNCPFSNGDYNYTKEALFSLQRIAFVLELAISESIETTRNNEIIYQIDCKNDRVQEIHTGYEGQPQSWGWKDNVEEQLSKKVKPISKIIIRNKEDIYTILTNREKLEYLLQEYERKQLVEVGKQSEEEQHQQVMNDQNKQMIIDFLIDNKDSIKIEDLKIYEPIYKCYRKKENCHICNTLTNIICINCNGNIWICSNHWQQHATEKHSIVKKL